MVVVACWLFVSFCVILPVGDVVEIGVVGCNGDSGGAGDDTYLMWEAE